MPDAATVPGLVNYLRLFVGNSPTKNPKYDALINTLFADIANAKLPPYQQAVANLFGSLIGQTPEQNPAYDALVKRTIIDNVQGSVLSPSQQSLLGTVQTLASIYDQYKAVL